MVVASFFFSGEERPGLAAAAFLRRMRWMALDFTALCAALLAIELSQHGGRAWPRALVVAGPLVEAAVRIRRSGRICAIGSAWTFSTNRRTSGPLKLSE
jgi:hypothetical protein